MFLWVYQTWLISFSALAYFSLGCSCLGAWLGWSYQDGSLTCVAVAAILCGSWAGAVDQRALALILFGLSIWLGLHHIDNWLEIMGSSVLENQFLFILLGKTVTGPAEIEGLGNKLCLMMVERHIYRRTGGIASGYLWRLSYHHTIITMLLLLLIFCY